MLWFLWISLVLIPAHPARCHTNSPGLLCTNDFVSNISCRWNRTGFGPVEDCWVSGQKKIWKPHLALITTSCKLKQHRSSSPGCSFVFENTMFSGYERIHISLKCNGTTVQNLTNYEPKDHIKMHPPGAPQVNITANFTLISWSPQSPVSKLFKSMFDFEVQIKQRQQKWEDVKNVRTKIQELTSHVGELKGHLEARVRVKPANRKGCQWSDWSPTSSWEDLADSSIPSQWPSGLDSVRWILVALGLCLLIVVVLVHYKSCKTTGLLKGKLFPNPSGYFQTLHSVHQGNLKEWLNPHPETQSFFVAPSCDQISHVVVCEDWNETVPSPSPTSSSTSPLLQIHRYPTSCSDNNALANDSSSLSSFSNVGYFTSSSSGGSARTDPVPAYFTFQDNFQNLPHILCPHFPLCGPLTSFPEYESLKREPESPDSGFGIMKEDEMNETQRVLCREEIEILNNQSSPLFFPPPHLPSRSPSSPSAHPSTSTQPPEREQLDVAETDTRSASAAQAVTGAMCRSSSMPVEPFKTDYLTLKELQVTFSNKSI